jgi:D-arabinose 1-dehydrogenase-like Zn-dependent alcohol dehydrogenase
MESLQLVEWGRPLQRVMRETPTPRGREVLLRVTACGVCHSDVHLREGMYDLGRGRKASFADAGFRLPLTLGHEIVGEVIAAGPDADVHVGESRVVFPWIGCGQCRHCLRDRQIDCETPTSLGIRADGGYSSHVLVPDARFALLHPGVEAMVAASAACSGITAYSALRKLPECTADDTVVLVGAGGLGLAALAIARHLTPAKLVVADIDPLKLDIARARADAVIDLRSPDAGDEVRRVARGGLTGVIDFVGLPSTFEWGLQALRRGGGLVLVGLFGGSSEIALPTLPMRNLHVQGSYVGTLGEFRELLRLLSDHAIEAAPFLARPLTDVNDLLDQVGRGGVPGRFMVIPRADATAAAPTGVLA